MQRFLARLTFGEPGGRSTGQFEDNVYWDASILVASSTVRPPHEAQPTKPVDGSTDFFRI